MYIQQSAYTVSIFTAGSVFISWTHLYNQQSDQETEHHQFPGSPSPATFQTRPIPSPRVTPLLTPDQTRLGSSVYVGFMESILRPTLSCLAPFIHHDAGEMHPRHRISVDM